MKRLRVLDVTLRDGGCVNDFNFGQSYMTKILAAQEASGLDIIELGYLDENRGSASGRTQYINEQAIKCILTDKKPGVSYVAMMDYGKFTPQKLTHRTPDGIDGIRVAFHKKDINSIPKTGREIISKGYELYIQPMITLRYSDSELLELIDMVNTELPDASGFYIVDSFGEMRTNDMNRMLNLVDHNLRPDMTLGFHSHNNLQLSYSNACAMLAFPTNRSIILDSSIMGMGKGAGNLNTELLLEHLNLFYGTHYRTAPLLEVIDEVINQLHDEFRWGYSVEYYLSSANHCTPSYASHFYGKHMLPVDKVGELLGMIDEDKKISFDRNYAEDLYRRYNESRQVDDSQAVRELQREFDGKIILLVAPGRGAAEAKAKLDEISSHDDVITIGLNNMLIERASYVFTTRHEVFAQALGRGRSIIAPSNIQGNSGDNVKILNYSDWIEAGRVTHDSSFVILMNLLKECRAVKILLAGFDGFSADINANYADPEMRHPASPEEARERNEYYSDFIKRLRASGMPIEFITPSKYETPYSS